MKSKLPPLALGAALAACAMVLAVAYWMLTSDTGQLSPEARFDSAGDASITAPHTKPRVPMETGSGPDAASEDARVALADESAVRVLPQVEFEVRTAADRPLAGALTLLYRGEEVLGQQHCASDGVVHFDAAEGHARLIVVAKDVPASVHEVPLAAGRHAISLQRGYAVSGRVRTMDDSSPAGVTLILRSDRPLLDESSWPEAVRSALDLGKRDKLRLVTRTDEAGQFEFTGLGSPWSGQLDVDSSHELLAVSGVDWTLGSGSVRLDDPADNLVLEIASLSLALGRVVLSSGGAGVAHADVSGSLVFEQQPGERDAMSASFNGRADADGRFALPIYVRNGRDRGDSTSPTKWPALRNASLRIDGGGDFPRRRLELSGTQLPEDFNFGELVLERGATLQFTVVDAQAKPLAGALGRLDGEGSEPTDEAGHASIAYAPGVTRPLSVSLDGYRDGRVDVPAEVSEALTVVLERTNRLTVLVQGPAGEPIVDVRVQVLGPATERRRGRGRSNQQSTDEHGSVTFSDLPADTPLRVYVREATGAVVADQSVTLEAEEWRSIQIALPHALLAFAGIVRDDAGLSLAEVDVQFGVSNGRQGGNVSTHSDADGRFSFSGLSEPEGTLSLRKTGFAPVTLTDFRIPPSGVIADIRMERGLRLTLRMVDERGAPVRGESLRLEAVGERPVMGQRSDDNEWDFSNLPRQTMTAVGRVGAREYRQDIEPLNGNQDFRVPAQGGLEVSLRLAAGLLQTPLRVSLRARDDRRVNITQGLSAENYQTRSFGPLLPGEYQLLVTQYQRENPRPGWYNVGNPQDVSIAAGLPQRVEIER